MRMRIPGFKLLQNGGRWLRSRFFRGALILGYHRVAADDDFYEVCVQPRYFAEQMAALREAANMITLLEFAEKVSSGTLPQRAVVVTLDDGYADNLYHAAPHLVTNDVPATLFVTTGNLGQEFWWDELARRVLTTKDVPPTLSIEIDGDRRYWQIEEESRRARRDTLSAVYQTLLRLPPGDRETALAQLRRQLAGAALPDSSLRRALTAEELGQMAEIDLFDFGTHSANHPMLANLTAEEQAREIVGSQQCLEAMLDRPITTFSYPNGSGNAVTRTLLSKANFTAACASFSDVAFAGSDPLFLPRFWVPDVDGVTFARWLRRWLV